MPAGGDGAQRGGRSRQGEADLAPTAAGGHDHPPVSGVHRLPPLREDPAAGTTPDTITSITSITLLFHSTLDMEFSVSFVVIQCDCIDIYISSPRMTAGWCWPSRRLTGCWRLCRSSSSSLQKFRIMFSWMQASL